MAPSPMQAEPQPMASGTMQFRLEGTSSSSRSNPQTPPSASSLASSGNNSSAPVVTLAVNPSHGTSSTPPLTQEVDPQIIEALKSKDRIYVLKLGELMENLIKEKRSRVDLTPATSYQRLLVHRCSAYYRLSPENDPATKGISVHPTPDSRIPDRRICELVPPESTSQPAFKIMRRSAPKPHSQAGSVTGEDGDLSDVEPSEAGSLGGRSNATGGSNKKHKTIQEREAAYNEARSRIFMDFEEKEKAKEKDMSASSSSFSLNSASASASSTNGDADESVGSPATESEWSGPYLRERKDIRRGGSGNASASSSTRSLRGYASNPSSRNSRASSPSFTFPNIYEASAPPQLYDPNQPTGQSPGAYGTQYYHPFAPPQGYIAQYPGYYPPYGPYQPLAQHDPHSHTPVDPTRNVDQYPMQPPMGYPPYNWHQPSAHGGPPPPPSTHPAASPPHSPIHYPYLHPPSYGSPMGYYPSAPPPGQQQQHVPPHHPPPPNVSMGMMNHHEAPRRHVEAQPSPSNGHGYNPIGRGIVNNGAHMSRINSGSASPANNGVGNSGKGRHAPAMGRTTSWSYGGDVTLPGANNQDAYGPRLSSSRRSGGGSSTASNNDDGLSTTSSSTTSSSSRRTYTSTTSSQHPLPARPDWAVGMKAQPTLARAADGVRHHGGGAQGQAPVTFQPTDFPPLSSTAPSAASENPKRVHPVPSGAWGNAANRAILVPPGAAGPEGYRPGAGVSHEGGENHGNNNSNSSRLIRRPGTDGPDAPTREGEMGHADAASTSAMLKQLRVMTIEEKIAAIERGADAAVIGGQ